MIMVGSELETFSNLSKLEYGPFEFWTKYPEFRSSLEFPLGEMTQLDAETNKQQQQDTAEEVRSLKKRTQDEKFCTGEDIEQYHDIMEFMNEKFRIDFPR